MNRNFISTKEIDALSDLELFVVRSSSQFRFLWANGSEYINHLSELASYEERADFVRSAMSDALCRCGGADAPRMFEVFGEASRRVIDRDDFTEFVELFLSEATYRLCGKRPVRWGKRLVEVFDDSGRVQYDYYVYYPIPDSE